MDTIRLEVSDSRAILLNLPCDKKDKEEGGKLCREKTEPASTEEEERRLMYVAVTRAQKKLYVTFPKTLLNKP